MRKRWLKIAAAVAAVMVVLIVGVGFWVWSLLSGSLPQVDGDYPTAGITRDVKIERDNLGIPTIRAANRKDLAFATGFAHGQDRFFQMDLLRRNSAGELSEIVGAGALDVDRRVRVHRFRNVAERILSAGDPNERVFLESYAAGVNAGLHSLHTKPFEYHLLGLEPAPWKAEDCALVLFSMFLDLQGDTFESETTLGLLHDTLPGPMFDFLAPRGTEWDAPMLGKPFATPPMPPVTVFDTRKTSFVPVAQLDALDRAPKDPPFHMGSNNWAISAKRTADGRAIVANDMHLGIRVPHIWYRASFVWPEADGSKTDQRITGLTLPGTPAMVVGSNGHIAWGFTNTQADWADVVIVDVDQHDKESYLTPKGPQKFEHHSEKIKVKNGPDAVLDVVDTIWGPVIDTDSKNRPRVWRWVAHDTEGVNMGLLKLESARTLEESLRLANLAGAPGQNFVVADDKGRIAWTVMGRLPRRVGFDGRLPSSWADGSHRWDGYLKPEEYPRIIDPADGRIWTANARVVSDDLLARLGDGMYDLGARAQQIRDDLRKLDKANEGDMLKIQLDDRAVFLERWRKLLLDTLDSEAVAADPRRAELRAAVENWGGRASIDSVGFRAVREFRLALVSQLSDVLVAPCKKVQPKFSIAGLDRTEGPVWQLVSKQPPHLIDPRFKTWKELLLSAADGVVRNSTKGGTRVADYTWGNYNTTRIAHPLTLAVPSLARWLNMPAQELPGDWDNMPRIQTPDKGASERMAVSPGHESDGYLHMPCGQSGHPLSPHFSDQHAAWAEGKATPFMPGPPEHTLVLKPAA
ncbi:MAG TPA: penicillin acylase family protein [Planctomycetaceae bacterium]|nr:penicillin acylase family protein [Planctomycetaceae bacterium]